MCVKPVIYSTLTARLCIYLEECVTSSDGLETFLKYLCRDILRQARAHSTRDGKYYVITCSILPTTPNNFAGQTLTLCHATRLQIAT